VQDALTKIKEFDDKAGKIDKSFSLVSAFLAFQDLIWEFEAVDPTSNFVPSATGRDERSSDYRTPRSHRPRSPINGAHSRRDGESSTDTTTTPGLPRRAGQSTKFPEYIWVLQVLNKITTVPHLRAPMQRFLKEKIFNNRHLTVGKVKASSILVLLRDFEKQETITTQRFTESPREQRSFKTDYALSEREQEIMEQAVENTLVKMHNTKIPYCSLHGHKDHTTENCRALQEKKGQNSPNNQSPRRTYYGGRTFNKNFSHFQNSPQRNSFPERSQSPKPDYYQRRSEHRASRDQSASPSRNFYSRDRSRSRERYDNITRSSDRSRNYRERSGFSSNTADNRGKYRSNSPHPALERLRSSTHTNHVYL
jgi:hypothetical protein